MTSGEEQRRISRPTMLKESTSQPRLLFATTLQGALGETDISEGYNLGCWFLKRSKVEASNMCKVLLVGILSYAFRQMTAPNIGRAIRKMWSCNVENRHQSLYIAENRCRIQIVVKWPFRNQVKQQILFLEPALRLRQRTKVTASS